MSIYTYLKHDHEVVKNFINQINNLDSSQTEQRDELFDKLKTAIIVHSKAEEKIFYKPLQKEAATEDEIPEAQQEHKDVEQMLEQLSDKSLDGAAWTSLFQKMCGELLHHIDEEEHEIFPDAKKELSRDDANQMERDIKKEKKSVEEYLDISFRHTD